MTDDCRLPTADCRLNGPPGPIRRCPRSELRGDSSNPTQMEERGQPRKPGPDSLDEGVIPRQGPRPSTHRAVHRIAAGPVRTAVSQNARRLIRQNLRRQSDFHLKDDVAARSLAHNGLLRNPCPLAHGHLPPCTHSTGHRRRIRVLSVIASLRRNASSRKKSTAPGTTRGCPPMRPGPGQAGMCCSFDGSAMRNGPGPSSV